MKIIIMIIWYFIFFFHALEDLKQREITSWLLILQILLLSYLDIRIIFFILIYWILFKILSLKDIGFGDVVYLIMININNNLYKLANIEYFIGILVFIYLYFRKFLPKQTLPLVTILFIGFSLNLFLSC